MKPESNTLAELTRAIRLLACSNAQLLTLDDAALYLRIARSTLLSRARSGDIPHFHHMKNIWFKRSDLDQWIITGRTASQEEIDQLADLYIRQASRKQQTHK
ncbi:MAG: helix-turn-helix domain-containing protein [Bacteroidales bacterium]|nr:helix-turn-helix domain-containing protein [Bacteroidales bacterium]